MSTWGPLILRICLLIPLSPHLDARLDSGCTWLCPHFSCTHCGNGREVCRSLCISAVLLVCGFAAESRYHDATHACGSAPPLFRSVRSFWCQRSESASGLGWSCRSTGYMFNNKKQNRTNKQNSTEQFVLPRPVSGSRGRLFAPPWPTALFAPPWPTALEIPWAD